MPGATEKQEEKAEQGNRSRCTQVWGGAGGAWAWGFPAFPALLGSAPFSPCTLSPPSSRRPPAVSKATGVGDPPVREATHETLARSHEPRPQLLFGEGRDLERGVRAEHDGRRSGGRDGRRWGGA